VRHNLAVRPPFKHAALLAWVLAACVAAAGLAWGGSLRSHLAAVTRAVQDERAMVARLQAELRDAEAVAIPRRRAQQIKAALDRDAVDPGLLRRIEPVTPSDVWLTSVDLARGRLLIDGDAVTWQSIASFADALSRVPGLANVQLTSLQARGGEAGGYDFHVTADALPAPPLERARVPGGAE
jgi:Tfp pilus assembly protein PilN